MGDAVRQADTRLCGVHMDVDVINETGSRNSVLLTLLQLPSQMPLRWHMRGAGSQSMDGRS